MFMKMYLVSVLFFVSTSLIAQVEVFQDLPPSRQREEIENIPVLGTEISNSTETEPRQTDGDEDSESPYQKFNPEWNMYKKDYLVSIRDHGKDFCLYAGWPSHLKNGKCQHPADLPKDSHERKSYTRKEMCKGTEVSCNPVIYGFRRNHKGLLFCVESKGTDPVAEKCLKESHSAEEDATTKDPLEKRLEFLRHEYNQLHPREQFPLFRFLYQGCLCPSAGKMATENLKKVQESDACFHTLKTMTKNQCDLKWMPDTLHGLHDSLKVFYNLPQSKDSIKVQYDALKEYIRKNDSHSFNQLCSDKLEDTPPPVCSIEKLSSEKDSSTYKVSWPKDNLPMTSIKWSNNESESEEATYTEEEIKKGVAVTMKHSKLQLTIECSIEDSQPTPSGADKEYKISTSLVEKNTATYTVKATVTPETDKAVIAWSLKNASGLEVKKGWEKKAKPKKTKPTIDIAGMPEGEDSTPSKTENSIREITQSREYKDYEACAKLTVNGKDYGESCSKIDRKIIVPANLKPGSGQGQQYIRGTSDTSAVGIK